MRYVSFTEAQATLAALLDSVADDAEEVVITRPGHEPVVLLRLADWAPHKETEYLLRSPANARHLRDSIAAASRGEFEAHDLIDP